MAFDRSKYTKREIKKVTEEVQTVGGFEQSDWAPIMYPGKLPKGQIFMNILPPHNTDLDFFQQLSTTWLKIEREDKDGKKEIANKPIFSGEVHSSTRRCVIAEYINLAKATIEAEETDAVKKQDKMNLLYGLFNKTNPKASIQGITPNHSFPMYVYLSGNTALPNGSGVYKLMANYTIKNRLKEIEVANQDVDQPMTVDVFTDPNEGYTLTIENTDNSGKDKYKVDTRMKRVDVPDSAYEFWEKQTPLDELYVNSYTEKDFDFAMEGLMRFDEETKFGVLETEAFLNIAEELSKLYPTKEAKQEAKTIEKSAPADKLPWEDEEDAPKEEVPVKAPSQTMDRDALKAKLDALAKTTAGVK